MFGFLKTGSLAYYSVAAFFFLSGYLTSQSFKRQNSFFNFLKRRVFRIYPALLFANIITVLLISNFVNSGLQNLYPVAGFFTYVFEATVLFKNNYFGNLTQNFELMTMNASLWTLKFEIIFYLCLGLFFSIKSKVSSLTLFFVSLSLIAAVLLLKVTFSFFINNSFYLLIAFIAGVFFESNKRIIHFDIVLLTIALCGFIFSDLSVIGIISFSYLIYFIIYLSYYL